jgi:hypothetical protein
MMLSCARNVASPRQQKLNHGMRADEGRCLRSQAGEEAAPQYHDDQCWVVVTAYIPSKYSKQENGGELKVRPKEGVRSG